MRMRRKPCHDGLAQLTKVVCEGDHFVAEDSGVDEQHTSSALHDNGVALAELALVGQHTLRDLPQHEWLLVICNCLSRPKYLAVIKCKQYGRSILRIPVT
jgi:hypothetical protein